MNEQENKCTRGTGVSTRDVHDSWNWKIIICIARWQQSQQTCSVIYRYIKFLKFVSYVSDACWAGAIRKARGNREGRSAWRWSQLASSGTCTLGFGEFHDCMHIIRWMPRCCLALLKLHGSMDTPLAQCPQLGYRDK